ncbi:MAG: hypothetical protein LBQ46_12295 [Treponema sp.]|jgi:hypothetical protein|nr:hypothetical protein [Treponema sp.]
MSLKSFVCFAPMLAVLILAGCKKPVSETQYYYYESFTILKTNYNSLTSPYPETYDTLKDYRNRLRAYQVSSLGSRNVTQADIYKFLTDRGKTSGEADNTISFLDSTGNWVGVFDYVPNNTYFVIVYFEKL